MGHRVTNHHSMCKNLHGHRYKMEIILEGDLVQVPGISEEGMVMDFSDVKAIAKQHIHDVLDHSFMVWEKDELIRNFYKENPKIKHTIVPFVPTAENISAWIFKTLDEKFQDKYKTGLQLESVKLWETPTSLAIFSRKDVK